MVVVGSVYEKNKIIKDQDQEIYARHFDRSLIRKLSLSRFAQAAHQACCEPVKITAKFQWFWILYIIILFFSYTRTAIQTTTESVCCTILAENFCFHRREALCVSDPSKLQFAKLQIDVDKFLSASVNEHKDYQLISFNIHIL